MIDRRRAEALRLRALDRDAERALRRAAWDLAVAEAQVNLYMRGTLRERLARASGPGSLLTSQRRTAVGSHRS